MDNLTDFQKPPILYKYASFEAVEKILTSNSLRFSGPESFNDPFDCDIDLLRFDISDCGPEVIKDIATLKEQFGVGKVTDDMIIRAYKASKIDQIKRASVTCFSLTCTSVEMWSHYANKHQGVCLQFNNLLEKRFVDKHELSEGFVSYGLSEPYNFLKNKKLGLQQLFVTKSVGWSYEQEYRLFWLSPEGNYEFYKPFLTGIHFGLRMIQTEEMRLREICRENGLNVSYYKAIKESFGITFENVS